MDKVAKAPVGSSLKTAIVEALKPLGGIKQFVKKGEVVFLKANFNTADPPPASTDLGFLKVVAELVYEAGAKMVMVGESSTMSLNTRKVLEERGVFELQNLPTPARVYVFEEGEWFKKTIPGGKYLKTISLPAILDRADKVIFLPCLKTHSQAQFTGSLKLSVGFTKPVERLAMHLRNLQEKVADLNKAIRCDLVIMDGRKCFINKGPSRGETAEPNLILASASRVAIDIEAIRVIQGFKGNSLSNINPEELPQIRKALEIGVN